LRASGYNTPAIHHGFLPGAEPAPLRPAATDSEQHANNLTSAVIRRGNVNGRNAGRQTSRSERVLTHNLRSQFWTGPLRSPERLPEHVAHESIMDEVASSSAPIRSRFD